MVPGQLSANGKFTLWREGMANQVIVERAATAAEPTAKGVALVANLDESDRPALMSRWRDLFGTPAPRSISQPLLRRFLAWEVQVRARGGLSAREREQIARLWEGNQRRQSPQMASGTRYLREWNGVTHVVEKVAEGYLWNGGVHASLSAIAGAITGAHWSGPRFFGVTRKNERPSSCARKGSAR
jgi:Protein of unknown function (DUF2924)